MDEHGEEIPGKGQPEELSIELRVVPVYQDFSEHTGGVVLKLEDFKMVQNVKAFARSKQTVIPDNYQTRELILCATIGKQVAEANIEEPELFKPLFLYAESPHHSTIKFSVEERIYKLERDEQAMLKRISDTNIKAMGVNSFLYDRLGGTMGEVNAQNDEAKKAAGEEGSG